MLLGAIGLVVWLAVMLVFVAACQMAARGDRALSATGRSTSARLARTPADGRAVRVRKARRTTVARHELRRRFRTPRSQPAASDDVRDGAQQDLDVGPERPVGHVEVVHHRHLPQR
jgi:hypothetical protein